MARLAASGSSTCLARGSCSLSVYFFFTAPSVPNFPVPPSLSRPGRGARRDSRRPWASCARAVRASWCRRTAAFTAWATPTARCCTCSSARPPRRPTRATCCCPSITSALPPSARVPPPCALPWRARRSSRSRFRSRRRGARAAAAQPSRLARLGRPARAAGSARPGSALSPSAQRASGSRRERLCLTLRRRPQAGGGRDPSAAGRPAGGDGEHALAALGRQPAHARRAAHQARASARAPSLRRRRCSRSGSLVEARVDWARARLHIHACWGRRLRRLWRGLHAQRSTCSGQN